MPSRRQLVAAHQHRVAHISSTLATSLTSAWDHLGYYDSAAADQFVPPAVAASIGAQRAAAAVTLAFVRAYTGKTLPSPSRDAVTGAAVRLGTAPADVYRRPFEQTWWRLSEGDRPDEAIAAGRERLDTISRTDVTLAMRATTVAVGVASAGAVRGWRRVADGSACDLCSAADGEELGPGDEWSIHPCCGCSAEPMDTEPDVTEPDPEVAQVHDHGELGPYLAAAGDSFSAE